MRKSLTVGIFFMLIYSVFIPLSLGLDVKTTSVDISTNKVNIPPFEDPPNLIWKKTYEGKFDFLKQTNDNGYIFAGGIYTSHWNAHLMKTDIDGNEEWNKTFITPMVSVGGCIKETPDGGYIVTGYYEVGNEMIDIWLIKTDENGNMSWDKKFRYEGYKETWAFDKGVIVLDDGYLILADVNNMEGLGSNIWLIKTDFDGNELWEKTVGNRYGEDWPNAFIKDSDGDIVICGSYSFDKVLLIKVDSDGNRIWRKTLDGEEGDDIKECDDGGYIISDALKLIKTNRDGNMQWRRDYNWGQGVSSSVDVTYDGGYILVGAAKSSYVMIKADKDGYREWEKSIPHGGGSNNHVIQSNDGNYVAIWNNLLIKVSPFENQRPIKPSKPVGPTYIKVGVEHNYTTSSSDPDGDIVYYRWENKYFYGHYGPYNNNEICEVEFWWPYIGKDGLFVKSRDIYGGDSEWSEPLEVTVYHPRNKTIIDSVWLRFLDMFPILQKILNFLTI